MLYYDDLERFFERGELLQAINEGIEVAVGNLREGNLGEGSTYYSNLINTCYALRHRPSLLGKIKLTEEGFAKVAETGIKKKVRKTIGNLEQKLTKEEAERILHDILRELHRLIRLSEDFPVKADKKFIEDIYHVVKKKKREFGIDEDLLFESDVKEFTEGG